MTKLPRNRITNVSISKRSIFEQMNFLKALGSEMSWSYSMIYFYRWTARLIGYFTLTIWLSKTNKSGNLSKLLPPATKLGQGNNIFISMCQEFCPWGHAWLGRGACMAGGVHDMHAPLPWVDTMAMAYGQWAGGTRPTGMHSCVINDCSEQSCFSSH